MHHTKEKGDLGNIKCQARMMELGFTILIPLTEHSPFDFVAYKDGEFYRVQSKYKSAKDGKIEVPLRSSWSDKNGTHAVNIDKNKIDLYSVYCPNTEKVYFIDINSVPNKTQVNLRIEGAKNNQKDGILFARDFEYMPLYLNGRVPVL